MAEKNEILGKRLKELRVKHDKKQEEVANAIEISRARYSHYENNHVEPDIDILKKLANFYKVTTDYLVGYSDSPGSTQDEELEELLNDPNTQLMFHDWKNMSDEERKEAIDMIKYIMYKNKKGD